MVQRHVLTWSSFPSIIHGTGISSLHFHSQLIDMPSIKSSVTFVAAAILAIGAQAQLTYEIDPNSVPIGTRGITTNSRYL